MMKQLKYNFYQVIMPQDSRADFATILNRVNTLEGRARLDASDDYPVRLHFLSTTPAYLLGDIARIRMNDIPPKMKFSGETESLDLDDDEGLGEVASFIYHPTTNVLMLMRNRNAVTISRFHNYIENLCEINNIQFKHVLQQEAYQRLQQLTTIQRLELQVAAPGNGGIFNDLGLTPQIALNLMGQSPRVRVALIFSTGYERERSLPRQVIDNIVNAFRIRSQQMDGDSMSLVVSGREQNYQKDVIDLFDDVLTDFIDVNIREQRVITDDQRHSATRQVWDRHRNRLMQLFGPAENHEG